MLPGPALSVLWDGNVSRIRCRARVRARRLTERLLKCGFPAAAQLPEGGLRKAMPAALTAENVLAADETLNVLDKTTPQPAAPEEKKEDRRRNRETGGRRAGRADRPHLQRSVDVAAGRRLVAQGRRRRWDPGPIHRIPNHRWVDLFTAPAVTAGRHPAMPCLLP